MIEAFDDETLGGDRAMFRGNNKADIQSLLEGFQAELIRGIRLRRESRFNAVCSNAW